MIRCCSKFLIPLSYRTGHTACLSRLYISLPAKKITQRRYASTSDCKPPLIPRGVKKVFYTTLGLTIIGIGGVVVYAKQDPKFRKTLENNVPGSDKVLDFVYHEAESFSVDHLKNKILSLPDEIYNTVTGIVTKKDIEDNIKPTKRESKSAGPEEKPSSPANILSPDNSSKEFDGTIVKLIDVTKLELPVLKLGDSAVLLFKEAIKLLEGHGNKIPDLIDKAVEDNDSQLWSDIRKQIDEQNKTLGNLEKLEKQADELSKKYFAEKKSLISKSKLNEDSIKKLNSIEDQLSDLKSKFQLIKVMKLEGAKNYFNKIEKGRKHFLEELNTLFPSVRLSDRQLKLTESEIDLFLYYAVQKLNYYQKEIAKLESQASDKLKKIVQGNPSLQEAIDGEVSKARRQIKEDFDKKVLDVKSTCEKQLHEQMKRQEQVHLDILNDQLILKEKEVERKLLQHLDEKVQEEQSRLTQELAEMTTRMQALNEAISKRALQDMKAQTSQALWSEAEALHNKLKRTNGDQAASELQPKPLAENVQAIKNAAAKGDDLVETVLATIPKTARDRGVYPEDSLRERFLKVESVAWRVAGVPDGGASLPLLLVAWLQSAFIARASEPIPPHELKNEPIEPSSLNNYDILQRARYWVDRGDFEQALKYMNLLKGGARSVSLDWMKEVTLLLEAQQAANLLLAHASASGMIYS